MAQRVAQLSECKNSNYFSRLVDAMHADAWATKLEYILRRRLGVEHCTNSKVGIEYDRDATATSSRPDDLVPRGLLLRKVTWQ